MHFKDQVVVITGASEGFGKALAKAFINEQSQVVISSDHEATLKAAANELHADHFVADVTSYDSVKALADYVHKKHGRIDVWINNAGIQIAPSTVEKVPVDKLQHLFAVNFFGYFYGCKAVLPIMKQQNGGTIIHINSTAGLSGKPGLSAYVSSKFAVKGLTESLREELKGTDIGVLAIYPGGMKTDIYKEAYPDDYNTYMSVDYAIQKVMDNLAHPKPEIDLIIRRPATN